MRALLNLLTAVGDLAAAISALSGTVREADGGLRARLQLDGPGDGPVLDGESSAALPTPKPRTRK